MMTNEDYARLRTAHNQLEGKSLAMKLASKVGVPIESLMKMLPAKAQQTISVAVNRALEKCLDVALMDPRQATTSVRSQRIHTVTAGAAGAIGGFFGLAGLAVELPVSTTVMLHSITEIARSHGEDLSRPEGVLACLEVFALGTDGMPTSATDSAYYATRAALAQVTRDAATHIAQRGMSAEGAPALVAFLSRIAARFGIEVSEKAAAQLVPVAGAVGGLALNVLFTQHFQKLADGHFTVRSLERKYGQEQTRSAYQQLRASS